jgi:hypothetical protein
MSGEILSLRAAGKHNIGMKSESDRQYPAAALISTGGKVALMPVSL